jgi:hypothetical protein
VYDIQDESARNAASRPFPFQRTIEPSEYAALFPPESGKSTVLYHACSEPDEAAFNKWLDDATMRNHHTLNLVGPSSSREGPRLSMERAAALVKARKNLVFGCVTIAERHLTKGTEHLNILRKATVTNHPRPEQHRQNAESGNTHLRKNLRQLIHHLNCLVPNRRIKSKARPTQQPQLITVTSFVEKKVPRMGVSSALIPLIVNWMSADSPAVLWL